MRFTLARHQLELSTTTTLSSLASLLPFRHGVKKSESEEKGSGCR